MASYLQYRRLRSQVQKRLHDLQTQDPQDNSSLYRAQSKTVKGKECFIVEWDGDDDPEDPRGWSPARKLSCTLTVSLLALVVGACAPIDSPIIPQAAEEFHVSRTAESLSVGNFLIGFGVGALVAGPFSEVLGRSRTYLASLGFMCIWLMASALAPNLAAQLVFRFLAGFAGASPLVCAGGTISDLYTPLQKTYIFPIFAMGGFTGPPIGSIISAFIPDSQALHSWRWTEWIALIFSGVVLLIVLAFQPETYAPTLLSWKAKHLRKLTGDERYVAASEVERNPLIKELEIALWRPFQMAFYEPVIQLSTLYLSVVYIVLFTFFDGYEVIFKATYDLSTGITYTIFVAIVIGILLVAPVTAWVYQKTARAAKQARKEGKKTFDPEMRLWFAMIGAPFVPISLFWMAWTADPDISIWSPILASAMFGFGIINVFISNYMYLIDSYVTYAASGLTFNTLIRYAISGGMTVVGIPFYDNMGRHWPLTIMGCISVLLTPLPYLFYRYGYVIRRHSRYAVFASDTEPVDSEETSEAKS